jgi:radical SAM superfamily enzyme YgiQ (UPF0313 family)
MKIKLVSPPFDAIKEGFLLNFGLPRLSSFLKKNGYQVSIDDLTVNFLEDSMHEILTSKKMNFSIFTVFDDSTVKCLEDLKHKLLTSKKMNFSIFDDINQDLIKKHLLIEKNPYLDLIAERIISKLEYKGFDLIGFSIISNAQVFPTLILIKKLREYWKGRIVLGGPFFNSLSILENKITNDGINLMKDFLKTYSFVDYIIVGRGEIPLLQLVKSIENHNQNLDKVPGLVYRKDNKIFVNKHMSFLDLNELPCPDFEGLPLEKYYKTIGHRELLYQISDGCAFKCSFCTRTNSSLSFVNPNKICDELSTLSRKYKIKNFWFLSRAINLSYKHLNDLCDKILEKNIRIKWCCMIRPDNLDKKIVKKMKEAGCYKVLIGVESGSPKIIQNMNKGFSVEKSIKNIKIITKAGIKTRIFLIIGYPHETEDDINKSIYFVIKNKDYISEVFLNRFILQRNSPIFLNPKLYGVKILHPIDFFNFSYAFDEINGLKWNDKTLQTNRFFEKIFPIFKKNKINFIL